MINEKSLAVFVKTVMDFVGEWSNINEGFDTNNYDCKPIQKSTFPIP